MMWCCWEPQNSVHLRSFSVPESIYPKSRALGLTFTKKEVRRLKQMTATREDWQPKLLTGFSPGFVFRVFFPSRNLRELKTDYKTAANNSRTKFFMISLHETYSAECFILQGAERKWNCDILLLHRNMKKTTTFMWRQKNRSVSGTTALHTCTVNVLTDYHFKKNIVGSECQIW